MNECTDRDKVEVLWYMLSGPQERCFVEVVFQYNISFSIANIIVNKPKSRFEF